LIWKIFWKYIIASDGETLAAYHRKDHLPVETLSGGYFGTI
jgi:hypothetical protein